MKFKQLQFINIDEQLYGNHSIDDDDLDKVFVHYKNLKELGFEQKIDELERPLLKIQKGDRTIYRKYKYKSAKGLDSGKISFTYQDQNTLNIKQGDILNISIAKKIDWIKFYFRHPKTDIRVAIISAIIFLFLSFILGLIGAFIYDCLDSHYAFFGTK